MKRVPPCGFCLFWRRDTLSYTPEYMLFFRLVGDPFLSIFFAPQQPNLPLSRRVV